MTLQQKGTKVVYAISYDEIHKQYEDIISTQSEAENENTFDYFLSKEIRSRIFWWRRVYHAETFRKWNSISGI